MRNTIEEMRPAHDQIAMLAYHLWERQGRPAGMDVEHWLMAERQLLAVQRAALELASAPRQEHQPPSLMAPPHSARTRVRPRTSTARRKLGVAPGMSARRPGSLVGTAPIACAFEGPLND
ncbi:MAG: DUF2934 domain-containing protein [Limisphaerales bacterium]